VLNKDTIAKPIEVFQKFAEDFFREALPPESVDGNITALKYE
jgi:hypothetical protein